MNILDQLEKEAECLSTLSEGNSLKIQYALIQLIRKKDEVLMTLRLSDNASNEELKMINAALELTEKFKIKELIK